MSTCRKIKEKKSIKESENIGRMIVIALQELEREGIVLASNDKAVINKEIKDTQNRIEKIYRLHRLLRVFTDLQSFYNAGREPSLVQLSVTDMQRFADREDLRKVLDKQTCDLEQCIQNNVTKQCSETKKLMETYSALVDAKHDVPNKSIEVVSGNYTQ